MTDKQTIIDGIDVSKCTCFDDGECLNPCETVTSCEASINCRYKQLKRKEQECEGLKGRLKYIINENKILKDCATDEHIDIVALKNYISTLEFHNDQLKAEVKSKTEYIQEQREIIDQYSKEIEMYKKCQGKRASKREEELKAENEELKKDNKELQYQLRCTTGREKEWERNCKFWDARCEELQTELNRLEAENKHFNDLLNQALKELEQSIVSRVYKNPTNMR